jgi:PEP-CTERM motif
VSDVVSGANISRAIARSRRARRALQKRRRRVALAAGACVAAAVPLSFSLLGVTGNDLVHAAASQAQSLSELLEGRSPGERTTAQLTKTKRAKLRVSAVVPPEHLAAAPPLIRKGDHGDVAQMLMGPPPIDIVPPIAEAATDLPSLPEIGGGSGPGVVAGPPGGGGGPVSFPASEPHHPVTPVSAVPEPSTWATMLLGFGLLGWRVRRRPKSTDEKSAA